MTWPSMISAGGGVLLQCFDLLLQAVPVLGLGGGVADSDIVGHQREIVPDIFQQLFIGGDLEG